jgi:hypothetical protein
LVEELRVLTEGTDPKGERSKALIREISSLLRLGKPTVTATREGYLVKWYLRDPDKILPRVKKARRELDRAAREWNLALHVGSQKSYLIITVDSRGKYEGVVPKYWGL